MQEELSENKEIIKNSQMEDSGAKLIFENPTLCAQLLRDYSNIDLLKNVQAGDITDVTERYIPMFTEERNADVVKKVRVGEDEEVFIALIEHKSRVDYNVGMQILRYMVYIWEDYEKCQEKKIKGISKLKDFKYPPIFPIVYYNGEETWSADKSFMNRVALREVFGRYIPKFCYHLVNTADYGNQELISKKDGLSFIMIVNKIKAASDFDKLGLPKEYLESLSENSPEDVLDVLARVIAVLLRKQFVPEDEIQDFVNQIKERHMGDLFEGWKGFNVQEERRIGQNKGEKIKLIKMVCKKLAKGKSAVIIADELDEELEDIRKIVDAADKHSDDYDAEKIYDELNLELSRA